MNRSDNLAAAVARGETVVLSRETSPRRWPADSGNGQRRSFPKPSARPTGNDDGRLIERIRRWLTT